MNMELTFYQHHHAQSLQALSQIVFSLNSIKIIINTKTLKDIPYSPKALASVI